MAASKNIDLLLVCASELEASGLMSQIQWKKVDEHIFEAAGKPDHFLLISGIGMVNTAFQLGLFLSERIPKRAIHFGIAGSFDPKIKLGEVVEVIADCYSELGAESPGGFLPLPKMGFPAFRLNGFPQYNELTNPNPTRSELPQVRGITVNTVSGEAHGILRRKQLWNPQVETMEGAAFFQCCLEMKIPFQAFRAISNYVEPRNRSNWKIEEALGKLNQFLLPFIGIDS